MTRGSGLDPYSGEAVWQRLDLLIKAKANGNQAYFARQIGFKAQQVHDYCKAKSVPSYPMVKAIVLKFNVSFDWIYRGLDTELSDDLKDQLARAARKERGGKKPRKS